LDLNQCEREPYEWVYGTINLPRILKTHSYINVAKMKCHMQTLVSLCTKNQKGLLDSATRKQFHRLGLHEPIVELARIVQPELCVMDAVEGVEGNGPGDFGTMKHVGLIVGGTDMLEVDCFCCGVMGIAPSQVEHLELSGFPIVHYTIVPSNMINLFKPPSKEFRIFNVYMNPCNACTACQSSIGKLKKLAKRTMSGRMFFVKYGVLSKLNIIIGSNATVPENHGKVILYGDCTKVLSEKHPEYNFFSGCPPVSKDVLEELIK